MMIIKFNSLHSALYMKNSTVKQRNLAMHVRQMGQTALFHSKILYFILCVGRFNVQRRGKGVKRAKGASERCVCVDERTSLVA
jgi:hypothetical protein